MASPVEFPERNFIWRGWPADGDRPEVADLPAYRSEAQTISCWELSDEEVEEIVRTRRVWIGVLGSGHPPVYATGTSPFEAKATESVDEGA